MYRESDNFIVAGSQEEAVCEVFSRYQRDFERRLGRVKAFGYDLRGFSVTTPKILTSYLRARFYDSALGGDIFSIDIENMCLEVESALQLLGSCPSEEEIEKIKSDEEIDPPREPTPREYAIVRKLWDVKKDIAGLELRKEALELQLISSLGKSTALTGLLTWRPVITRTIDREKLRLEFPEVAAECARESISRRLNYSLAVSRKSSFQPNSKRGVDKKMLRDMVELNIRNGYYSQIGIDSTYVLKKTAEDVPSRLMAVWSRDEDEQLISEVECATPLSQIATNHGRSEYAILLRLLQVRVFDNGQT
jgi:hypothetical protein